MEGFENCKWSNFYWKGGWNEGLDYYWHFWGNGHYITLGFFKNKKECNTIIFYRDAVNNDLAPIKNFVDQTKYKLICKIAKENYFSSYFKSAIYALNDAVKIVEFICNN